MAEVTAVETLWPPPLLLSGSVEADWRQPMGEVTDRGGGGEVAEVTPVGTLWPLPLLLSGSMEAVWWR